jgi:hypothetical protein
VEFKSIISLASEAPVDVRVELEGSRWCITTSGLSSSKVSHLLTKDSWYLIKFLSLLKGSSELNIHSLGFSSNNVAQAVPNINLKSIRDRLEPMNLNGMNFPSMSAFSSRYIL